MISKEEVIHIAKLARLELSEKEVSKMQKDLSAILDYFNLLKKAKKPAIEKKHAEIENVLRGDVAESRTVMETSKLISAAPDKKDDYIKVKSIL